MSSGMHRRAKELFLAACDRPEGDRAAFLDAACGSDAALREEVESLLGFHESQGPTSHLSIGDGGRPARTEIPKTIGNYRIVQLVGEGGMGEVYEAEQEHPVRRRVALKLIKWGMDTREVVARFESERQALALMDHPHIARVYEAGATEEGRPYFAMEFVRGVPITEYCDVHRLSTRARLELFAAVCDAVQHAHRRGVIHRDIKPSNLLVMVQDDRPVPKIIDFGVAKATSQRLTERTVFTELGQWIGTPEYMSPEQAEMTGLDVDTRTDVYSLGVVLYELLAGVQPFDSTTLRKVGFDEMRRRIREEEPQRPSTRVSSLGDDSEAAARRRRTDPSTLARELKGDLDWIVMKALEKDRTRRYGSPTDLATDIGHFLANEPVNASPPSTTYRLRKYVQRNRITVAAGLTVAAALVIGIAGTTTGLIRARHEARTANQVARLMEGIFADLDPTASGRRQSPEMILDRGVAKIEMELEEQPLVQARLMTTMGTVYLNLGHFDRAGALMERGHEIRREYLPPNHPDLAVSLNGLGWYHYRIAEFGRSQEIYEKALEIRERAHGSLDSRVAQDMRQLARVHWVQDHFDIARGLYQRSLEILELGGSTDELELASTLHWYAILLIDEGEFSEAEAALERSISLRERILGTNHPAVAWPLTELGRVHHYVGDYATSESAFRRSLAILEETLGPEALDVAFPVSGLANLLLSTGSYDESLALFERALEIREGGLGPIHIEVLWTLPGFGWTKQAVGQNEDAVRIFEKAIHVSRRLFPEGHHLEGRAEMGLGYALLGLGDEVEAAKHVDRGARISEAFYPPTSVWLAWPLSELGEFWRHLGNCDESREPIQRAVSIWTESLGPDNIQVAKGLRDLARWELQCGDPEQARLIIDDALEVADRFGMPSHHIAVSIRADHDRIWAHGEPG